MFRFEISPKLLAIKKIPVKITVIVPTFGGSVGGFVGSSPEFSRNAKLASIKFAVLTFTSRSSYSLAEPIAQKSQAIAAPKRVSFPLSQ